MISKYWHVALIVLVMGGGGFAHLLQPELFTGFVFAPLPPRQTVLATGLLQLGIAVLALLPRARSLAGLAFALLSLAYMPLHIWDLFRDDPMISPLAAAVLRILVQVVFIWAGVRLWQRERL